MHVKTQAWKRKVTSEQKAKNNVMPEGKTIKGLAVHVKYFGPKNTNCIYMLKTLQQIPIAPMIKKKIFLAVQGGWNRRE